MQFSIVLGRLDCIVFCAASFAVAAAAPSSDRFMFLVALKGALLAQMAWTSTRILYQAICFYFGVLDLDSIQPMLFVDAVVMLVTYGTSVTGVASALYLHDLMYCQRMRPTACPMYLASSVLGLVATLFSAATTLRLFWARASLHHED